MHAQEQRYRSVLNEIFKAECKYNRQPGSVTLVAVSKTHPSRVVREMAALGQVDFAENYLNEAIVKQHQLQDLNLQWHFIGHIQSNKTKLIAEHFNWAHGVDRFKIANRLSNQRPKQLPSLNICIQVNLESESTKSGINSKDAFELANNISKLPGIKLRGLMAIPSPDNPFEKQRMLFAGLRKILEKLNRSGLTLDVLSMGMTDDMEAAIAEGATHVRIGTALFGPREHA